MSMSLVSGLESSFSTGALETGVSSLYSCIREERSYCEWSCVHLIL